MLGATDGAVRVRTLVSLRRRGLPRSLARRAQAVRARPDPACTGKLSIGCIMLFCHGARGLVGRSGGRDFVIDNLQVRIHLIIEMILVDLHCAMEV